MSLLRELDPAELSESYEQVDANGDVKAKAWEGDDGQRRVYVRVRRHDDSRRFDEFWIPITNGEEQTVDANPDTASEGEQA